MLMGFIIGLSSFIQGVTSFGFSLVALPLLVLILPFNQVVPILVLYSIVLNIIMLSRLFKHVHLRMILLLLIGGAIGIPFGIYMLKVVSPVILKQFAGIMIVVVASILITGRRLTLKNPEKFYGVLGLTSGVMQGSLSLSGPPIVLFLSNQNVDKMTFRANLTAYFTMMNVISIPGFILSGVVTQEVLVLTLKGMPLMVLGLLMGMYFVKFLDEKWFKKASLGLMIVSGVMAFVMA